MSNYDYDLFTIGAGSGGVRASRISASYGAKVAIAENHYLGGTCVNVGCVPKKLLFYASHFQDDFENAKGFGWKLEEPKFSWQKLIENKNTEIKRLNGIYKKLLENAGVTLFEGTASFVDEHTIKIGEKQITAERILIGTGSWPSIPELPGKEHIISSNEFFYLPELAQEVVIVGGGYIAVEFAGILNALGCKVKLLYRGELFLRGFDKDIRLFLAEEMKKKGVELLFNTDIKSIKASGNEYLCELKDGGQLTTHKIIYATGRHPNTKNLGIENTKVELAKNGAIKVNEYFQTSVENIYALGDVIDRVMLTPVAIAEGMAIAANLYKGKKETIDYTNIPTAVFSQPNIGTVGLTEEEAKEQYKDIAIYLNDTRPMKHTLSGSTERALLKLIVNKENDKVLGMHMVGHEAGEIMQGFGAAIKCGVTKEQLDSTVAIHPTLAEEFVTMRTPTR